MGFYGNIRNTTSNSFKFDRIYPNRVLMEQHADDDGVFGGRYVLIEYDQSLDETSAKGSVKASETVYKVWYGNNSVRYYTTIVEKDDFGITLPEEAYTSDELDENGKLIEENKVYYIKFGGEITDIKTFKPGTLINVRSYTKFGGIRNLYWTRGENPTVRIIEGVQIWGTDAEEVKNYREDSYLYAYNYFITEDAQLLPDKKYYIKENGIFKEYTGEQIEENPVYSEIYERQINEYSIPRPTDADAYTINEAIDRAFYGIGRGYDSTVWRKTYLADGKAKYVNIAELNSVVPTFAVTADAPSDFPQVPHYDKDSTNVYYNLHLQTPWGFRVADVEDSGSYINSILGEEEDNSDYPTGMWLNRYDANGHYVDLDTSIWKTYKGAIYFNAKGFEKDVSHHSSIPRNEIRIDNYSSGRKYTNRGGYIPTEDESWQAGKIYYKKIDNIYVEAEVWEDGLYERLDPNSYDKQPYEDTKELSVILPAIGNTVAEMWDLMYGTGQLSSDGKRQDNLSWDDPNYPSDFDEEDRLRLVHDNYYSPKRYYDTEEKEYRENYETLAGCINSVHDVLGMIITTEERPDDPNRAHEWQIYYDNGKYYYAAKTLGFDPVDYPFKDGGGHDINTVERFKEYFNPNNQEGYTPIENVKNIQKYVQNLSDPAMPAHGPIFTNHQSTNSYKLVDDGLSEAEPGALYYKIPTKLKSISAMMSPSDERTWYYHPDLENGSQYPNTSMLPIEDEETIGENTRDINSRDFSLLSPNDIETKTNAMDDDIVYYWVDVKLGSPRGDSLDRFEDDLNIDTERYSAWVMSDRVNIPYFRRSRMEGTQEVYDYEPVILTGYKNGSVKSFEELLEANGITLTETVEEAEGEEVTIITATKVVNNITYTYDLTNIYYVYRTFIEPIYAEKENPEDEDVIIGYREGKEYSGRDVKDILYPKDGEDTAYYWPINKTGQGWTYIKATWKELTGVATGSAPFADLAHLGALTGTPFKYSLHATALNNVGDTPCWYIVFKDNEDSLVAKEAFEIWGQEHPNDAFDLEDAIEDGSSIKFIDCIKEFNKHNPNDGYNWKNQYFTCPENEQGETEWNESENPIPVGYGLNSKPAPEYEENLIKFFTDKIFYDYDDEDQIYKLATKEADPIGYIHQDNHTIYRKDNEYYIRNRGDFVDEFSPYEKLNTELILTDSDIAYYFAPEYTLTADTDFVQDKKYYQLDNNEYVLYEGNEWISGLYEQSKVPLTIGYSYTEKYWKELYGFDRDVNSLHGWLLRLNDILQMGDIKTRDSNTVQGCINQLHDILEKFDALTPGELYGVNKFGKIDSVNLNSVGNYVPTGDNNFVQGKNYYQRVEDPTTHEITYVLYEGDTWITGLYEEESWVVLETSLDDDTGKTTLNVIHKTNTFANDNEHAAPTNHNIFGFDHTNDLHLINPVIDNAGHVVGQKPTEVLLADLLLKTTGTSLIATLDSPKGDIEITSSDILREAINKLVTHINQGADNITLNNYNNYYNDAPYYITNDEEPQSGKTYYIKQGNTFVEYTTVPWESGVVVYERYPIVGNNIPDVDNDDNINEAIAKLQWQLNHIANRKLTDLSLNQTNSVADLTDNDTLGNGLYKLQNRLHAIENFSIGGSDTNEVGIINNFAGIIRASQTTKGVPTSAASPQTGEFTVSTLRCGWIWINTDNNYVYIKTKDGCKAPGNFTDNYDNNYWELLNAWQ